MWGQAPSFLRSPVRNPPEKPRRWAARSREAPGESGATKTAAPGPPNAPPRGHQTGRPGATSRAGCQPVRRNVPAIKLALKNSSGPSGPRARPRPGSAGRPLPRGVTKRRRCRRELPPEGSRGPHLLPLGLVLLGFGPLLPGLQRQHCGREGDRGVRGGGRRGGAGPGWGWVRGAGPARLSPFRSMAASAGRPARTRAGPGRAARSMRSLGGLARHPAAAASGLEPELGLGLRGEAAPPRHRPRPRPAPAGRRFPPTGIGARARGGGRAARV